MANLTQSRSFPMWFLQPITWLTLTSQIVQENTQTKHNPKSKQSKIQQNKTTLVQWPLPTLGQEMRWAYTRTLPSPHGATCNTMNCNITVSGKNSDLKR